MSFFSVWVTHIQNLDGICWKIYIYCEHMLYTIYGYLQYVRIIKKKRTCLWPINLYFVKQANTMCSRQHYDAVEKSAGMVVAFRATPGVSKMLHTSGQRWRHRPRDNCWTTPTICSLPLTQTRESDFSLLSLEDASQQRPLEDLLDTYKN